MKDNAMQKEHHELEKASRNHKRDDSNHLMILLTSILNQFQTVTSLKNQIKERKSKEETSLYSSCIENSYSIECRKKR